LPRNPRSRSVPVPQLIWLNGQLVPPEQAAISVYDHGLLYGDGVFEGIRCYNGRIFKCATHLRRLFDSARAIRLAIPNSAAELAAAMRTTLKANARRDSYIRLVVTRGKGKLGINPDNCERPSVFIIVDGIALYPPELYEKGLSIITASTIRMHPAALSPRIKSLNYLNNILAKLEAIDAGVPEAVMLNHLGFVSECTGDNIFIVRQAAGGGGDAGKLSGSALRRQRRPAAGHPVLLTPPLHAGILEGVTMNTVIELAVRAGVKVERIDLTKHDLYTADEMFLTGTAAEIIPVNQVDGRVIGDGKPGPITQKLMKAFGKLVKQNAPED
jgi:branched-chain amino acid aminotransferase